MSLRGERSSKPAGRRFGQERPPLSVIIKQILERYPDGQIFKELIQNADDAGAKTVWFYVDERQHNTSNLPHPDLARFQGPALVAANDACFKEEDWKGIRKLQQSVKAEDPFKVGRFGIGFNSVYHITDLPILVSGADIGILDPQEELWPGDSGKLFELGELQGSGITNALHGIASFNRYSLNYPHTIFRLPLRTKQSSLSRNIYSANKVKALLGALRLEAKHLLLFLKSVTKIEVIYIDKHSGRHQQTFCVSVDSTDLLAVNSERSQFLAQLHKLHSSSSCQVANILLSKATFQIKVTDKGHSVTSRWVVVTQVGSSNTEILHTAEELHIFPWVGVAVEMSTAPITDNGRVFCFLPLPPEVTSGLPVHVNGTFSLNDERRTLKWTGAERTNDNTAKWNDLLVTHLLPGCYFQLLRQLRDKHGHEQFYHSWPDPSNLQWSHWKGLLPDLYQRLFAEKCMWSTESHCWVSAENAIFVERGDQLDSVVTRVLTKYGYVVVQAPDIIWSALEFSGKTVTLITPSLTRQVIRYNKATYEGESAGEKLKLLRFCLSDNKFSDLENITLVPLANGKFTTFTSAFSLHLQPATKLYVCSREYPRTLIPNQDNLLIDLSDTFLQNTLLKVAKSGRTQLQALDAEGVAALLPNSFPPEWRRQSIVTLPCHGFPIEWFETFWNWVQYQNLSHFAGLQVLPVATKSTRNGFCVTKLLQVHQSSVLIVPKDCPKEMLTALAKLRVNCTMTKHTPYVKHSELFWYVHESNPTGILTAISNARVDPSNVSFNEEEAMCLQQFLAATRVLALSPSQKTVLSNLSIFKTLNNSRLISVSAANSMSWESQATLEPHGFQLTAASLPDTLVIFSRNENYTNLFNYLAMDKPSTMAELIQSKVFPMIQASRIPHSRMDALMTEIIQLLPVLKRQVSSGGIITVSLSQLPFLLTLSGQRKAPANLFDPFSKELRSLYLGEDVFPISPFNEREYIAPLRECGLQTSVTAQQLFNVLTSISLKKSNLPVKVSEKVFSRVEAVMDYISSYPNLLSTSVTYASSYQRLSQAIRIFIIQRSCLPVLKRLPSDYPRALSWKGASSTPHLVAMLPNVVCCTSERLAEVSYLVGSEAYIVQIPEDLSSVLHKPLDVNMVLGHFRRVLTTHKESRDETLDKHLRQLVHQVYSFLNKNLQHCLEARESNTFLYNEEWIWLSKQRTFAKPQLLALEEHSYFSETQLEPYLHVLPDQLRPYAPLFQEFGVQELFSTSQIISVLTTIKNSGSRTVPPKKQWSVVTKILEWITDDGKTPASSKLPPLPILYVPIETKTDTPLPVLEQVGEVVYTDLSYLKSFHSAKNKDCKFIHHRISYMAHALGAKGLSEQLNIAKDAFGDVGPHESLITRLKNILKDYQDGLTIIKELLQNADDAEATEVNICYDARSHRTDPNTLLFPGMAKCHGPALLVHNNGVFTADDFKNIEKLAAATKSGQHLKIGKFGLGFCSVYHLTDIPSFVSRDRLYIFDPTLEYLKEVIQDRSRPGKCLRTVEEIVLHSKQLDPYTGLFGFEQGQVYNGTMFRFPFRTEVSDLSRIKYSGTHIKELMSDVKEAGSKLLLFLRHVNHITFSQIQSGQSKPTVLLDICKKNVKTLISVGDSFSETTTAANLFSIEIGLRSSREQEKWVVATHSSTAVNASGSNKYGVASVSCSVQKKGTGNFSVPVSIEGEIFCFLPLSIRTGLPVHVSSNFAVKNDRSGIHSSDEHRKSDEANWNIALMESVIPQAYCSLLVALQGMCEDKTISANDYKFTSLWPLGKYLRIRNPWIEMIEPTYSLIIAKKLFYSSNRQKWLMLKEIKVLSHSILCLAHKRFLPECVVKVMESLKYNLVSLPAAYQDSLPVRNTLYIIDEKEFLRVFFASFERLDVSFQIRNKVLNLLLLKFAETLSSPKSDDQYLQSFLTQHRCIPCKPDGKEVKFCSEIVDPFAYFALLYDDKEGVFPVDSDSELAHVAMKKLGMISERLPWRMVIDRARSIKVLHKKSKAEALQRVVIILRCVGDNLERLSEQLPPELMKISFLPVMAQPRSYPDFLFWQGKGKTLLSCQEALYGEDNHRLAGSQEAIVCEKSPRSGGCGAIHGNVRSALNIRARPSLNTVVKHLCYVADKCAKQSEKFPDEVYKWIDKATFEIFKFFETELGKSEGEPSRFKKLQEAACIWTGREFVSPKQIAIKWDKNGPHLYKLPSILNSREKLIKALSIQERFTVNQLLRALKELHDVHDTNRLESRAIKLIEAVVSDLAELIPDTGLEADQTCYLPDEKGVMREASMLAFNDAPWCKVDNECFMVYHSIPREVAKKLGVKLVRAKALESYEASEHHFDGVEFGQHEELTQRIKNILNEYPFDITVIKELLQNADDAKAKKLYFILDKRSHDRYRVPSDSWKDLQGPAMLIWNDKGFSPDDLKGIQKLGLGSKRSKSEAIGQYGIGFNVVYHLTDCPSFITNGNAFCVMDPHMRHVPGASEHKPGRMYENLDESFWKNWSDLKAPYLREKLPDCPQEIVTSGSLFRFPLRHKMELVKKSMLLDNDCKEASFIPAGYPLLTAGRMEEYLDDWAPKMKDALIFLNNVVELKFFVIECNNKISLKFHFKADLEKEALSKRLAIQQKAGLFKVDSNQSPTSEFYSLCLSEKVPTEQTEKWLVKRGIGDSMNPAQHWEFLPHVKPNHGLATPMGRRDFRGNVFCFLPLPMHSHLPVHVNGNFILDAARSGLWRSRDLSAKDDKTRWNDYLIEALASSYSGFVVTCQDFYVEGSYSKRAKIEDSCRSYYHVFPCWSSRTSYQHPTLRRHSSQSKEGHIPSRESASKETHREASESDTIASEELELMSAPKEDENEPEELEDQDMLSGVMRMLARSTYKKLFEKNAKIHIVIKKVEPAASERDKNQPTYLTEWHPLINEKEPSKQVHFWSQSAEAKKVAPILKRVGLQLSVAPIWLKVHFRQVGRDLPEATPTCVFAYYKQFYAQVSPSGRFPCLIKETSFRCVEDFKLFTEFVLMKNTTDVKFPAEPWDLPLLVTADNKLNFFNEEAKVIHTTKDYSSLFKNSPNCFLHPSLLDIKYIESYFLKPSEKNWSTIQDILQAAIPTALHNVSYVKEVTRFFSPENVKLLWECLNSETIFRQHLEDILKEWALLVSTDGTSFSCKASDQLLPVIPPRKPDSSSSSYLFMTQETDPSVYEVYNLLSKHSMPILDISICNVTRCKKFCPEFSNPKDILNNMYHHYKLIGCGTLYTRGVLDSNVQKLFKYLAKIHFAQDDTSLTRVKSLPLFRDISGCYKALEKEACLWPGSACMVGSEKWLNEHTTVFLPYGGDWYSLAPAAVLRLIPISPLQLYTKFIFPSFGNFSHEERVVHLKHIRDTEELFETAYAMSENEFLHTLEKNDTDLFIAALQQLPCLPINGVLKPLNDFYDPESKIFKLFFESLHFPPEDLRDEDWLSFFRKIGMRTDPTPQEFQTYCKRIAGGRHKEIVEASKTLVEYLCQTDEWHDKEEFLREVSKIPFVCAHKVPKLAWIKAPCPAPNIVQQGKKSFSLTSLRGSVVFSSRNSKIVWTVRCLVELPRLHHNTLKRNEVEETHNFLGNIGISLDPSSVDVVTNLCNISRTEFSDFGLFHTYQDKLLVTKRGFPLVDVIHEHFLYLQKAETSVDLLGRLQNVLCVPVCQEGKVTDIKKPVLVKPVGVVATPPAKLKHFSPYLNPLPDALFDVTTLLAAIGVNSQVQLEQVQFALDTIKECTQERYDPNITNILKELLKQLYLLLPNKSNSIKDTPLKYPLHLPKKSGVLIDSKGLLFDDLESLRDATFDLSQVNFSFMSLLVNREDEHNEYGFTADDLRLRLPEHVQPLSLSKYCKVQLHEQCRPNSEDQQSEFVVKLRKVFKFPQFAEVVFLVLSQYKRESEEKSRQFSDHLKLFLENLQVLTVKNLKVTISLSTVDPPALIGTASTDFHFEKEQEDSRYYTLYVEEIGDFFRLISLFETISEHVAKYVLEMSSTSLKDTDKIIRTMMRAENPKQVQDYLRSLQINTSNLQLEESIDHSHKPKVGDKVPEEWHHRLQCDINNYFRPQELAALEVGEEQFIYVIVEHKIQSTSIAKVSEESDDEESEVVELDKYLVRVSEDEDDTKTVTVVDLYKLLSVKEIKQDDGTTAIVLYDSESTSVKMWDSVKGDKLKDIMKEICHDLRRIWKLKDKDEKRKAIKALYLRWHPDKNSHPLATKAFQFLQQQITRLEQGLPLEDPRDDWEQDSNQNWASAYNFSNWDDIIRERNRTWRQEQSSHYSGGGGGGGGFSSDWTDSVRVYPDTSKAKVWLEQAEFDQEAMEILLEKVSSLHNPRPKLSAHVCFLACQVAEKSIKAGMYQVWGLQSEGLIHHKFVGYAGALEQEGGSQASGLRSLANKLENYYVKTRYPNAFSPHKAPSKIFSPSDAREAEMVAKQTMEIIRKIVTVS